VIQGDDVTDGYVERILRPHEFANARNPGPSARAVRNHLDEVPQAVREDIARARLRLRAGGRTEETYRRLPVEEALGLLAGTVVRTGRGGAAHGAAAGGAAPGWRE
jgi:hypothetical protein